MRKYISVMYCNSAGSVVCFNRMQISQKLLMFIKRVNARHDTVDAALILFINF